MTTLEQQPTYTTVSNVKTNLIARCRQEPFFEVKIKFTRLPGYKKPVAYIDCPHCARRYFVEQAENGSVGWMSDRLLVFYEPLPFKKEQKQQSEGRLRRDIPIGTRRVRLCKASKNIVIMEYTGENDPLNNGYPGWLCLHNETIKEDIAKAKEFKEAANE